jgi:hypothetical protein
MSELNSISRPPVNYRESGGGVMNFGRASLLLLFALLAPAGSTAELAVGSFPSIQAALDANPGCMIFVPAGDYAITEKIRLRGERVGLYGPGRIIQQSADQPIIEIENARCCRDSRSDAHSARRERWRRTGGYPGDQMPRSRHRKCARDRQPHALRRDHAAREQNCRISRCLVRNYMRVTIDDRTASEEWGYAFNCTDGTGISVSYSTGTLIEGNRIIEDNFVPTPEIKAKHKLGDWVKKNAQKGTIVSQASGTPGTPTTGSKAAASSSPRRK